MSSVDVAICVFVEVKYERGDYMVFYHQNEDRGYKGTIKQEALSYIGVGDRKPIQREEHEA